MDARLPAIVSIGVHFIIFPPRSASAEGVLPVDLHNRSITVEHIKVEVSEAQELEMDIARTVTLSPDQWTTLRKKGLVLPMRLDIVDFDADTCACALMGHTAIRLSPRTVGILLHESAYSATDAMTDSKQGDHLALIVDRRGQFYADGILVPYAELLSHIRKIPEATQKGRRPNLFVAFPIDLNRNTPAVKERIDQLESAAAISGWDFQVEQRAGETGRQD